MKYNSNNHQQQCTLLLNSKHQSQKLCTGHINESPFFRSMFKLLVVYNTHTKSQITCRTIAQFTAHWNQCFPFVYLYFWICYSKTQKIPRNNQNRAEIFEDWKQFNDGQSFQTCITGMCVRFGTCASISAMRGALPVNKTHKYIESQTHIHTTH